MSGQTYAVMWRSRPGQPWRLQPYMRPEAMAVKEAEKMLIQFGGEAAIAPLDPPSEVLGESK